MLSPIGTIVYLCARDSSRYHMDILCSREFLSRSSLRFKNEETEAQRRYNCPMGHIIQLQKQRENPDLKDPMILVLH